MDITNYLNQEKIISRNWEELNQEIARHRPKEFIESLVKFMSQDKHDVIEVYTRVAEKINGIALYDYFTGRNREATEANLRYVISILPKSSKVEKILDLCTGSGLTLGILGETYPKAKIFGIDLCPAMLERAKERLERRKLSNVQIQVGNRDQIAFENHQFDLITCINGIGEGDNYGGQIQHQTMKGLILTERLSTIREKLRSKGETIISFPLGRYNAQEEARDFRENTKETQKSHLLGYFQEAGFENITCETTEGTNKEGVTIMDVVLKGTSR